MKTRSASSIFERAEFSQRHTSIKKWVSALAIAWVFLSSLTMSASAQTLTEEEKVAMLASIINDFISKAAHPNGICIYDQTDFRGDRFCFTDSQAVLSSVWDNKASSMSISADYLVTAYDGQNFSGTQSALTGHMADLGAFNNIISSISTVIRDEDGDGIEHSADACPGTPIGEAVAPDGCGLSQIDTDGDGVFDLYDQCANSAPGDEVTVLGCTSAQDSDGDGTLDGVDPYPFQSSSQCQP